MSSVVASMQTQWEARKMIPTGVWLLLIAYSLEAFASPMPETITWLEILMGSGLLMGGIALSGSAIQYVKQETFAQWCMGLTALLFILPLSVGFVRGNTLHDTIRDVFPLAFLLLIPVLITYSVRSRELVATRTLLVLALVFVGIGTSVVFIFGILTLFGSTAKLVMVIQGGLQHLQAADPALVIGSAFLKVYDPSVLFTAIFLSAWGGILVIRSWQMWFPGAILASLGALIAYEFMMLGLRAYTVFYVLSVLVVCLTQWKSRGLYIRLLPILLIASVFLWPTIEAIFQLLWIKQQVTGTNGKASEWLAVMTTLSVEPKTLLLGIGWGGTVNNPILGESTRFTHSMLSFYFLKTGAIGVGLLLAIVGLLLKQRESVSRAKHADTAQLILQVSCLSPLLIGVLFEPTYKMLSYGVIFAVFILVFPVRSKRLE